MAGFNAGEGVGVAMYLSMPIMEIGDGTAPLPHARGEFSVHDHLVDSEGRLATGLLASIADSIGGMTSGVACLPDWIVTTNLALRRAPDALVGPRGTGSLTLDTRILRRGRSSVVGRTDVTDQAGNPVATTWMTCAVLTPAGGPPPFSRPVRLDHREVPDDPIFKTRPEEFFALGAGERPGIAVLDVSDRLRNPWGILHGGSVAVVLDAAARSLVAGVAAPTPTPGIIVTDLVIHYLSPGRVGPVHAVAEAIGIRGAEVMVRISVRDCGADDRLMALAVVTVRTDLGAFATDR
jgi:uncharacterized protein (TIGR00369 family)